VTRCAASATTSPAPVLAFSAERARRIRPGRVTRARPDRAVTRAGATAYVSQRITSAHDLGRILYLLHSAAMGDPTALKRSGLSLHEARVGLALLLGSQPTGDNLGLFRPNLDSSVPIAQKNGWLNDARHTAAIIYGESGPTIVVLLTYRPGITRPGAAILAAKVLKLALRG
jgi:hypothetical protein